MKTKFSKDDLVPPLNSSQMRLQRIIQNKKKLGLTPGDMNVLHYLYAISTTRMIIPRCVLGVATDMQINDVQAYRAIQKLRVLDLVRYVDYCKLSYLILDPMLINWGTSQKRAFKIKLWEQAVKLRGKGNKALLLSTLEEGHS
ncbi:MAG: hypothetical protein ACK45I_09130 [Bacteroidota bacterium]|jgi:hypothetical protein